MTNDWKLILKVVLGSAILMLVVIYGLSRMAGTKSLTVDQTLLLEGAKLVKENGETKVTVVNFSDVECPACKIAHEKLAELNSMPGVKIVFRHFPLAIHKNAMMAARAVEAATEMGKGWEMMDWLFGKQNEWSEVSADKIEPLFVEYAKSMGLDEVNFKVKLDSSEVMTAIQNDINIGNNLKLAGTPTVFVNGEQVAVDFVIAKVKELIKNNGN
jgi:protein-disulfide isomerase